MIILYVSTIFGLGSVYLLHQTSEILLLLFLYFRMVFELMSLRISLCTDLLINFIGPLLRQAISLLTDFSL